ncbi:uncharacterized protein LDX57_007198 [Aspergillus melleus]|uniref:uncharacterized protein n=1 Tax=Aspergillus melleus TaxID=138277 RepID=UPI001E8E1A98|nr:uncharacterized protein LDX57_007198 [Aspergillus melleus]KAH8429534.1 hypothetical protein LDX57_007198 [Aspergillus melleus]
MSSFRRTEKRHAPEFKISQAHLEAVRELCDQFNKKPHVDSGHPSGDLIRGVRSREEGLDNDVGEAQVLEREDLETSGVCLDTQGTFTLASEAPVVPWGKKKPRAGAEDRSFTIGDQTREQLLQSRKYLGSWKKALGIFSVTIHSCIELLLRLNERPTELTVKAEVKPLGQRHPQAWAQETLATDPGSRLAFYVTYTRKAVETSSYVTSNLVRDLYKANSFVH